MENNKINKFIHSNLKFESGELLKPLNTHEGRNSQIALAASGNRVNQTDYHRVGMLSNEGQSVIARIFHSKQAHEYRLYFLNESGKSLTGSLITAQNTFKYFFIDEEQHAIIPEDKKIDPLIEPMMLVTPDVHIHIGPREWTENSDELLAGAGDYLVQIQYEKGADSEDRTEINRLHCQVTGTASRSVPTKLLYRQSDIFRLVPVQHQSATLRLPTINNDAIELYLYR